MDLFRGILFECIPSSDVDWSADACKEISEAMLQQAATEKMAVVVIEWPTAEEISRKKANEAGIPIEGALEWDITFTSTSVPGAVHIESEARGIVEILPGFYGIVLCRRFCADDGLPRARPDGVDLPCSNRPTPSLTERRSSKLEYCKREFLSRSLRNFHA